MTRADGSQLVGQLDGDEGRQLGTLDQGSHYPRRTASTLHRCCADFVPDLRTVVVAGRTGAIVGAMDLPPTPPPSTSVAIAATVRPPAAAPWRAPVRPLRITRHFRLGAPYAAGGHRGIDLATTPGAPVRSPCAGTVTFAGRVAGSPPTLTIACAGLRATLQRAAPSVGPGARVGPGDRVATATARRVDLSARLPSDAYVDPAPLIATGAPPASPPLATGRRAREPRSPAPASAPRSSAPARASAPPARVSTVAVAGPAELRAAPPDRLGPDAMLGAAGAVLGGVGLLAAAALRTRREARHRAARSPAPRTVA